MKIAIASTGKEENSEISPIAGRAPYFLIYKEKKLLKVIKNPFSIGGGGAGTAVAKMLSDEKVESVVAGYYRENMKERLKEKNIKILEEQHITVKEALEKI